MKLGRVDFTLPFNERVDGSNPSSLKWAFADAKALFFTLEEATCVASGWVRNLGQLRVSRPATDPVQGIRAPAIGRLPSPKSRGVL